MIATNGSADIPHEYSCQMGKGHPCVLTFTVVSDTVHPAHDFRLPVIT